MKKSIKDILPHKKTKLHKKSKVFRSGFGFLPNICLLPHNIPILPSPFPLRCSQNSCLLCKRKYTLQVKMPVRSKKRLSLSAFLSAYLHKDAEQEKYMKPSNSAPKRKIQAEKCRTISGRAPNKQAPFRSSGKKAIPKDDCSF